MMNGLALIGFGEAASAFVSGWTRRPDAVRAYDLKTDRPETAEAKLRDMARMQVTPAKSSAEALANASIALSLVTADQALLAAQEGARHLRPGTVWFDCNSVAPDTKRAAAKAIEAAGGRYVDVAVMSPVHPAKAHVPLLVSGPHAEEGAQALLALGFTKVRVVPGDVGRASSIKMIRSVMVKGIEALTAECVLAASEAGVLGEVLASLDASPPKERWQDRADYNLDRMMVHGLRRAAEMEEVVKTLDALGTGSAMTRGTVERQRAIGEKGLPSRGGLEDKIGAVLNRPVREEAA
jgi:3-hydroxyisobutyrate dehydrogenase-like beta-hydroxyacid dehydrogenase